MNNQKIFALLVGIDNYPIEVPNLNGCKLDVYRMKHFLEAHFEFAEIQILVDRQAKRKDIIDGFREHLAQAKKGDTILFYFSGHGSQQPSALEFREFFIGGKEETIVCFDSRSFGGRDLADKELAVLFNELETTGAHIVGIFDCCHSGGITRQTNRPVKDQELIRMAPPVEEPGGLDEYLDGYYVDQFKEYGKIFIPSSSLIKISACKDDQVALESSRKGGLFSFYLFQVLSNTGLDTSYIELFKQSRRKILSQGIKQVPQFQAQGSFDGYSQFLIGTDWDDRNSLTMYCEGGSWWVDKGAVDGISTEHGGQFCIEFGQGIKKSIKTLSVGPERSTIEIGDLDLKENKTYQVSSISHIPTSYCFSFKGDQKAKQKLSQFFTAESSCSVELLPEMATTKYGISMIGDQFQIRNTEKDSLIFKVEGSSNQVVFQMISRAVEKIIRWEQGKRLRNHQAFVDPQLIDFQLSATSPHNGEEYILEDKHPSISILSSEGEEGFQPVKIKVRNRTGLSLHFCLLYYGRKFGVQTVQNELIPPNDSLTTFYGNNPQDGFTLPAHLNEVDDFLQLLVSREKIDHFLLEQSPFSEESPKDRDMTLVGNRVPLVDQWMVLSRSIKLFREGLH